MSASNCVRIFRRYVWERRRRRLVAATGQHSGGPLPDARWWGREGRTRDSGSKSSVMQHQADGKLFS